VFRRVVDVVQVLALVAVAFFVVMLFANEPSGGNAASTGNASLDAGGVVFAANCARCHGSSGEGGIGPQLAGSVTQSFPDPADEAAVVHDGRGSMPSFAGSLTDEQIQQVVAYTRSL
jgi:cytochrome c6